MATQKIPPIVLDRLNPRPKLSNTEKRSLLRLQVNVAMRVFLDLLILVYKHDYMLHCICNSFQIIRFSVACACRPMRNDRQKLSTSVVGRCRSSQDVFAFCLLILGSSIKYVTLGGRSVRSVIKYVLSVDGVSESVINTSHSVDGVSGSAIKYVTLGGRSVRISHKVRHARWTECPGQS